MCLVRLAPRPAGSVQPSLCPFGLRSAAVADLAVVLVVALAAVVAVVAADLAFDLVCLGSVAVAAVVAPR